MEGKKNIRVLLSKSDQDAHEVGIRYVAISLKDAGMEVIFTRYTIIDEVAETALQENVDVIGLSFYGAGLRYDIPRLMELLKERNIEDTRVLVGGTITEQEKAELLKTGIRGVFTPGSGSVQGIVNFITSNIYGTG